MFGLFKSRKSPVRRRLEDLLCVKRTWFEWTFEDGRREAVLVVELHYDTDPGAPSFDAEGLDEIAAALAITEPGETTPTRVRIVPRGHES